MLIFSPTHKRTEGRAPVWGSELGGYARHRIVGLRRGNARHRLKHVATSHPPAGPHTNIQCRNRRRHTNRSNIQRRRDDTANDPNS